MSVKVQDHPEAQKTVLLQLGCTPEQKVFLFNGYPAVYLNGQSRYVHRLVAQRMLGAQLQGLHVHHVDGDRRNFLPENLHTCTLGEHNTHHRRAGAANHFFGKRHTQDAKSKISRKRKARVDQQPGELTRLVLSLHAQQRPRRPDGTARFAKERA